MKTDQETFQRFNAQWTPTILMVDGNGVEQHRIEGFLPVPDYLAQVRLGLAHAARARGDWKQAEERYRALAEQSAGDEVGAEATYWTGVSRYKGNNDAAALGETAAALSSAYPASSWTKKASVWG